MTILNLMLGKQRGGLEQAALDYAQGLALANIPSLTVISPGAWVETQLVTAQVAHEALTNHGPWDLLAILRLRALAKRSKATAIICHGNRAVSLATRALKGRIPVIAVAHNYSTRRFVKADRCFAITQHSANHLAAAGITDITLMPNMTRLPAREPRPAFRTPPIIGSMGRFVAKKGFRNFIEALSVLRNRGVAFHAVLGGDGDESEHIDTLITGYGLQEHVTRIGWVKDKASFFESLDIFVLPSLHEPFGIVLIEAMSHAVPVISTDTEGPSEIITDAVNGILVPRNAPETLADALEKLLSNPSLATTLGAAGRTLVEENYTLDAMAARLKAALAGSI